MPRRCYTARLDSNSERPWERSGFNHENLSRYVRQHRGKLLWAAFTLIRAWYWAGRPKPKREVRLGSFQEWTDAVGGVFDHAGIEGFLSNLEGVREVKDEETRQWSAFFAAWWETIGPKAITTDELCGRIFAHESLTDAVLPDALLTFRDKLPSLKRSLGRHLSRLCGRIFDGRKLVEADEDRNRHVKRWELVDTRCEVSEVSEVIFPSVSENDANPAGELRGYGVITGYLDPPPAREQNRKHIYIKEGADNPERPVTSRHQNSINLTDPENSPAEEGEILI
jgi:DNA polymerase-1